MDFTPLVDPPVELLPFPQPRLERVLEERASELGAVIRRGHEVVGLSPHDARVTADVRASGQYRVSARYLAGWDGAHSRKLDTYHDERHLAGERTLLHTRARWHCGADTAQRPDHFGSSSWN